MATVVNGLHRSRCPVIPKVPVLSINNFSHTRLADSTHVEESRCPMLSTKEEPGRLPAADLDRGGFNLIRQLEL
jgi:hypothetical protein